MKTAAWLSLLAAFAFSAGAAELPRVVIVQGYSDELRNGMTQNAISALREQGFVDQQSMNLTVLARSASAQEITQQEQQVFAQIVALNPTVVIGLSLTDNLKNALSATNIPVVLESSAESYVDEQGMPKQHIAAIYTKLEDMVLNSYKFLRTVAPLQAGQQAVFLENTQINIITKDAAIDALRRLNLPLKAVVNATIVEDYEAAILKYNDDPEVGWILISIYPVIKRDGSTQPMVPDTETWTREHLKKPTVTYWESAVQGGLLCGFGVDLATTATQAGEMAARVLKGEDVKTLKAEYPRKISVSLNRKTADVMGIIFPPDVLSLANVIYHDWEGKEVTRKSGL